MLPLWDQMPELDKNDRRPLYVQLSTILAEYTHKHRISPGIAFPTEVELMERFGLSRTTVRQAIQYIEGQGLIHKVAGKGTFVSVPKRRNSARPFKSLEPSLAEQGLLLENVLIEDIKSDIPKWALDLDFSSDEPVRLLRRLKLLEGRPLAVETRVLPLDIADMLKERDVRHRPIPETLDVHPQSRILQVAYCISGGLASPEEKKAMKLKSGTPVIVRRGVYYNEAGRPIMASKLVFVAERIELHYEFHRQDDNWGSFAIV